MSRQTEDDDARNPITRAMLAKWAGVALSIAVVLGPAGLWGANLISSLNTAIVKLQWQAEQLEKRIDQVDALSITRNDAQEKEITSLQTKEERIESAITDLQRKMDVAISLLEHQNRAAPAK
jgi:hypothetical protein